ncbi:TPA: hypothetical protein ACXIDR_003361 [Serratia marcescens]
MKLIGNLCILAFVVWAVSFFSSGEKKKLPSNEALISQFDEMGIFDKSVWKKGNVVDGMQVYTTHTSDNLLKSSWVVGDKQVGVIAISSNRDPALEGVSSLGLCYKLVKGVMARDNKEDSSRVTEAFKRALSSKSVDNTYHDTVIINGYKFDVNIQALGPDSSSYGCVITEK